VVFVTFEDVEGGEHEFVFFLNQLVEQCDVLWVVEVVLGKGVHVLDQLVLPFRERALGTLDVTTKLVS